MRKIILILFAVTSLSSCGDTPIEVIAKEIGAVKESLRNAYGEAREECEKHYETEEEIDECVDQNLTNV